MASSYEHREKLDKKVLFVKMIDLSAESEQFRVVDGIFFDNTFGPTNDAIIYQKYYETYYSYINPKKSINKKVKVIIIECLEK